ncbi:MAG: FAD-dependent oxidoreductase, partial [Dehalococcoidia bacterium]
MEETQYLIIGNSAGGIGAAEAIRQNDKSSPITIISAEPYPAYSRVRISEYLASDCSLEEILLRPFDFYTTNNIRFMQGKKAELIDSVTHVAKIDDGTEIKWQKLLLATGGLPIIPSIEGGNKEGVFSFINLDDAIAIKRYLDNTEGEEEAVVIGGGLIGISATEALVKRGVRVMIVEMKERILNTILDEEASQMEAEAINKTGVEIITRNTVTRINGSKTKPNSVSSVTLNDGRI